MKNGLHELQILEKIVMAAVVSSSHVFEETLRAEIITSDLELFDFYSLLSLAQGQTALSFL